MILEAMCLIYHHVVPLDLVQNGCVLQNQLVCGDDDLQQEQCTI